MSRIALAALAAVSIALPAVAETQPQKPANTTNLSSGEAEPTGLVWRCGKKNPAMWGTFGNGCLKQKRAHKKKQKK